MRKEQEAADEVAETERREILEGNPLLDPIATSYSSSSSTNSAGRAASAVVPRRWDDDVVFKNQANKDTKTKRFVNDTVRNDFHRKFLKRYVR
jgi:protein CWC15